MPDDNEIILAVKRVYLFPTTAYFFTGFRPAGQINYESIIEKNFLTLTHGSATQNKSLKQPIAYVTIYNVTEKKFFIYQRATEDKDYGEKGLQGKLSLGFGGHMKPLDNKDGGGIRKSLIREIGEETGLTGMLGDIKLLGYVNDESNDVNRIHFGMLYAARTDSLLISPKDPEIKKWELKTLKEIQKISKDPECKLETWSRIALEPLSELL